MPVKMISTASHVYAGKRLKTGDRFDATGETDARLMRALKRATDATPEAKIEPPYVPPVRQYSRKVVEAAPVQEPPPQAPPVQEPPVAEPPAQEPAAQESQESEQHLVPARTTRRYQRRDMTSTED